MKLAKERIPPSKIGTILRDQHAVPSVKKVTGKSMDRILDARCLRPEPPEDLMNEIRKAVRLYSHLDRNPGDFETKRVLEMVDARLKC